jgi:phosphoribosylglycinamide formyltransferase 1
MIKKQVGVLISGRGSNLQALLDTAKDPNFPAEIAVVLSNKEDAYGLERAKAAGIPGIFLSHKNFKDREEFEKEMTRILQTYKVDLVCLAGFMRLLTPCFIGAWPDKIINIHPSLLPAFPGLDTHRRALEAGADWAGCTVHYVRAEMDAGPMIVQAKVPILPGDDEERLSARVLGMEHEAYPLALRLVAEGKAAVSDEGHGEKVKNGVVLLEYKGEVRG